ncbi:hypothetical protein SK128_004970 [Halocaridina rubra]|uniref:Sushi domain-containing protein n=1 Tax=Halocaridina rubra TaxID=373956 RepID=A0AAN8WZD3_HALRR
MSKGEDEEWSIQNSQRRKKDNHSRINWRMIAAISTILALLLAIGLSVALGIFLRKTECSPPPKHLLATTTYLGSAKSGSEVTYFCPRPLVFPNNEHTFPIQCQNRLKWNVTDIPPCGRDGEKHCNGLINDENFDLSLVVKDDVTSFMVELRLEGQIPKSYLLDVDSEDETKCSYGTDTYTTESFKAQRKHMTHKSPLIAMESLWAEHKNGDTLHQTPVYTVRVTDSVLDPGVPYEILIRGSGNFIALTLRQGAYLNITFQEIDLITPETTSAESIVTSTKTTTTKGSTSSVPTSKPVTVESTLQTKESTSFYTTVSEETTDSETSYVSLTTDWFTTDISTF